MLAAAWVLLGPTLSQLRHAGEGLSQPAGVPIRAVTECSAGPALIEVRPVQSHKHTHAGFVGGPATFWDLYVHCIQSSS